MIHLFDYLSTRSCKTAFRLGRGAAKLAYGSLNKKTLRQADVISFDVFGTVLIRKADEHYARTQSALETVRVAKGYGLPVSQDAIHLRNKIERALHLDRLNSNDPEEMHNKTVLKAMLLALGAADWAESEADRLAEFELEQEICCTQPNLLLHAEMQEYVAQGKRVILTSDTRYSADELKRLLTANGIQEYSRIYASADWGVSKFRGFLYDVVASEECVHPEKILHIGDNLVADILSARERGYQTRFIKRLPPATPLEANTMLKAEPAYRLGYDVVGPALIGFTQILFDLARARGIRKLAFLSRDGFLLYEIAKVMQARDDRWKGLELSYVKISRRLMASSTASFSTIDEKTRDRIITDVRLMRGPSDMIARLRGLFNLPEAVVADERSRLGLTSGTVEELCKLLGDSDACKKLDFALADNENLLIRYLSENDLLSSDTGIVDIGWRGTLHVLIGKMAERLGLSIPDAYFLGFWDDGRTPYGNKTFGILADQRRGRNPLDTAAFQICALIESCVQASHGMASSLFFNESNGSIEVLDADEGGARQVELMAMAQRTKVQEGTLDYAAAVVPSYLRMPPKAIRANINRLFFWLAYFPTAEQRAAAETFCVLEPSDDEVGIPLILSRGRGFKAWFSGLRSPWKGGYFMTTTSYPGAFIYLCVSSILNYVSEEMKIKIRTMLFGKHA